MVDTSQLVKDERDIFSSGSQKVACLFDNEELANLAASAPPKSLLARIYHEKTRLRADMLAEKEVLGRDRCLVRINSKASYLLQMDGYIVTERNQANLLLVAAFMIPGLIKRLWFHEANIYQYKRV